MSNGENPLQADKGGAGPQGEESHKLPDRAAVIEELKNEIERLKDVEERFRLAAKATSDAVWDWDLSTNTLTWNENIYTLFGFTPEDSPNNIEWWYERLHPEEREDVIARIHKVIDEGGNYWQDEYRFRKKDDTYADIRDSGYILFNEQGKAIRMVGAMQDITERKYARKMEKFLEHATEELFSSLDYDHTLIHATQICVPMLADLALLDMLNKDGTVQRITFAQTGASKESYSKDLVDFPSAQALFEGKPVLISHPETETTEHLETKNKRIIPPLKIKSLISVPVRCREKNIGALTLISLSSGRIYSEKDLGVVTNLGRKIGIAIEKTYMYQAQVEARRKQLRLARALKESEELFRRMQEASVDGFILLKCVRNDKKQIVDFEWKYNNHAAQVIVPAITNDLIGKSLFRSYPKLKDYAVFEKLLEIINTEKTQEQEFHHRFENRDKWLRIVAVKIDDGVGISFSDISQSKILDRQKDEFIGLASHELKTPITSIWGYLQLLEQTETSPVNKKYISKILVQVKRLQSLITDLLDISKIQAGKLKLQRSQFSLCKLLDETIESMRLANPEYEIIHEGYCDACMIYADPSRIEQVITNLLSNAIKYSPDSKKVILRIEKKDKEVVISVTDFGIGMSPEQQEKIFDRFHQVHSAKKFQGLGLGLYISRDIVQRHSGKIWLKSELGKGSTFYFSLPLI